MLNVKDPKKYKEAYDKVITKFAKEAAKEPLVQQ
jgi:hypothetical protein